MHETIYRRLSCRDSFVHSNHDLAPVLLNVNNDKALALDETFFAASSFSKHYGNTSRTSDLPMSQLISVNLAANL